MSDARVAAKLGAPAADGRAADARPPLDAVVFDAGGTLVRLDFEWMAAVAREYGRDLDAGALRRAEVRGRRRYDRSLAGDRAAGRPSPPLGGRGDIHDYFGGMLMAVEVPAHLIGTIVARYLARERAGGLWTRPNEGARAALDWVLARGLRCGVVSNSDGRAEQHLHRSGVRAGLEFVVDSEHVGIEKPDPRIFAIALDRLGVAPDRALYVGDIRSVDEAGARAAGMRFVLIDPSGDYGDDPETRIAAVGELGEWIERRFTLGGSAARAATPGAAEGG